MKCKYCEYEFICFYENEVGPCFGPMQPIALAHCFDDDDNFGIHTCQAHQYMDLENAEEWWRGPRGYQPND